MTIVVLLIVWFAASLVLALALGAFIRVGQGPRLDDPFLDEPLLAVPEWADSGSEVPGATDRTSGPEDLAA